MAAVCSLIPLVNALPFSIISIIGILLCVILHYYNDEWIYIQLLNFPSLEGVKRGHRNTF